MTNVSRHAFAHSLARGSACTLAGGRQRRRAKIFARCARPRAFSTCRRLIISTTLTPASDNIPRRYRDRSKLRDCDVVALKVDDIASNGRAVDSGNRPAKEKGQPVGFELTEQIREAVDDYRIATGKKQANFNGA
jgi:hypothetical protein